MGIMWEICLNAIKILTLIVGISGIILSLLLLLSPDLAKRVSNLFNKRVNMDQKITYLNKYIPTEGLIFRHNIIFGIAFIAGSIFSLIFLFFQLEITGCSNILSEVMIKFLVLLGRISGLAGIVVGLFLLLAPEKIRNIEEKMSAGVDTQSVVEKLDEFHHNIDPIFFRYPRLLGSGVLIASVVLTILSTMNILYCKF